MFQRCLLFSLLYLRAFLLSFCFSLCLFLFRQIGLSTSQDEKATSEWEELGGEEMKIAFVLLRSRFRISEISISLWLCPVCLRFASELIVTRFPLRKMKALLGLGDVSRCDEGNQKNDGKTEIKTFWCSFFPFFFLAPIVCNPFCT